MSFVTTEHLIQILLLLAALLLAYYTWNLAKQQKVKNEEKVMPWFRIRVYNKENGRWVIIQVARNIAKKTRGVIFIEREGESSIRIPLKEFRSLTAMPGERGEVWVEEACFENYIDEFVEGDQFRIQADLEYDSILGGKYKSSHWLIMEKTGRNGTRKIRSDMKYEKIPF
ncbi:MAG: hypothetical protein HXS54_05795 [Theionarchaea archaeon]|nr:hypothetical protein [Theionarchaea archaeon]